MNGEPALAVSAQDRGLQYGDGVFESLVCRGGRPLWLDRHLARLRRGLDVLGIAAPAAAELDESVRRAAACEPGMGIVKLIVTRGPATARGYRAQGDERATTIVSRHPYAPPPAALRVALSAVRLGHNRLLAGIKHLNRLEQVLAQRQLSPDCDEVIMLDEAGRAICGSMSNLFLARGDALVTPRLERCGIAGVMRTLVFEAARAQAIPVEEADVGLDELQAAGALALCNVRLGLTPVIRFEGRALGIDPRFTAIRRWIDAHAA